MKRSCILILLLTGFLCFTGCRSLEHFLQKPTVTLKTIKVKDMTFYNATAVFYFDVTNPNPVGGTLRHLTYDLAVNRKSVVRGTADKGIDIPAEGTKTVELPVSVNYFDIIDSLTELVTKNEIVYDLSGSFNLMGFALPYHVSGSLPLPKLPDITVRKVNVKDFTWAGAAIDFVLELENANSFSMKLKGIEYDISMGGKPFINGTSQTGTKIPKNGKTTLTIPFDVNFIWLGKSAYDVLSGDSSEFELNGEMIFDIPGSGEKRFPFSKAGNVFLNK